MGECDERYGLGAVTTYLDGDVTEYGERLRRFTGMREGHYQLATSPPNDSRGTRSVRRCSVLPSACWPSMKRTASASGATISVPTTSTWSAACERAGIRRRSSWP